MYGPALTLRCVNLRASIPQSKRLITQHATAIVKHIPRKRFGQHFLADGNVIGAIVDAIAPKPHDFMVEIGPGLGAMTQPLVERLGRLTVVELDRDLATRLRLHPQLHVVESDVLKVDFELINSARLATKIISNKVSGNISLTSPQAVFSNKMRIVGNLPYNISTPILFHLLGFAHLVQDQHFMLQKEVIDRMVAKPSTPDYGRLSVMLQYRYEMENILNVPPESFDPPPRVMSAVVHMVPHEHPAALDFQVLEELVKVAFSMRRKLLRHSLGAWLQAKGFTGTFDLQRRAEEVSVAQYETLARQVSLQQQKATASANC